MKAENVKEMQQYNLDLAKGNLQRTATSYS